MPQNCRKMYFWIFAACFLPLANVLGFSPDASFINEQITRLIGLTHNNGIKVVHSFKVSRKDESAATYLITLPSEDYGGRIARFACEIDGKAVVGTTSQKTNDAVILKVPVPDSFAAGTITCNT